MRSGWACGECDFAVLLEDDQTVDEVTKECPQCGELICPECAEFDDCSCWEAEPNARVDPLDLPEAQEGSP